MRLLQIMAIISSLTGLVHSIQLTVPNPSLNVTAGNSATLTCLYSPAGNSTNNLLIQWTIFEATTQNTESVYYLMSGQANTGLNYRNRLTAAISPGNATIIINNVQPGDTGIYTCEVLSPPNPSTTGKIQLTVQVAPSTPHCTIRGAMDTGHYLSLLCYSEEGMPRPTYSWNKVTDGVLSPTPPQMNQKKGILIIGNMSKFDDGHYRCTASNFLGNSTCELDLHTGGEGGIIAAAVIGALVLATIIIVAIWFLIVKKKHKKREPATSETKPINSPGGNPTYASEVHEPARENLVASAAPETIEFHDRAENVASANGEMEDPSA